MGGSVTRDLAEPFVISVVYPPAAETSWSRATIA